MGGTPMEGRSLDSPGKLTTWSNLGSRGSFQQSPPQPVIWQSKNREENNNGNNDTAESRKTRSMPDFEHQQAGGEIMDSPKTEATLVNAFMRGRMNSIPAEGAHGMDPLVEPPLAFNNDEAGGLGAAGVPLMKSKDTVNQFLKTNTTPKLTSIEEQAELYALATGFGGSPGCSTSSGGTASGSTSATLRPSPLVIDHQQVKQQQIMPSRPTHLPPKPPLRLFQKSMSLNSASTTPSSATTTGSSSSSRFNYPDLNFLENDVNLWDAFFLHGKTSGGKKRASVLRPALPIDEYLKKQESIRQQEFVLPTPPAPEAAGKRPPPIYDSDSLRTLLPAAQKHLASAESSDRSTPISQVCQSLSRLHMNSTSTRTMATTAKHDLQNEAIKSMFSSNPSTSVESPASGSEDVRLVKVKQAWAASPEGATATVVRRRKSTNNAEQRNLNLLNNNGSGSAGSAGSAGEMELAGSAGMSMKRRSYHPQDYLSKVLDPSAPNMSRPRRSDFPKVRRRNAFSLAFVIYVHTYV